MVARVLAGDRDLFRILVARYGVLAKRTAVLCGAGDDADDVVQDAFVAAYQALPRFRRGEPFRPWLLRIVANRARNVVRGRTRAQSLVERVTGWDGAGFEWDPAATALNTQVRDALVAALGRLAATDREVLAMRFLLDLSEAETAAMLRLPKGTVKSRTARALARLRQVLAEGYREAGATRG